jgi:hypothetical protein
MFLNRVATAFFRGTATGGGTTPENNQRLKVASLCQEWKTDPIKGGDEPFLDAAIVGWNRKFCPLYLYMRTFDLTPNLFFFCS